MSDVPRHPAGWYPDPANPAVLRWWDGLRWTDATQPAYRAPAAPAAPPTQAPVAPSAQEPAAVTPSEPAVPPVAPPLPSGASGAAPAATGAYPATTGAYPAATGAAPATTGVAPAAPGAYPATTGASDAAPPATTGAYPAAPGAYPAAEVRRDIPTNTVWIWLVVLLPLLSLATLFLLDWRGYLEDVVRQSVAPGDGSQTWMVSWTIGSLGITLFGYLIVAAQIVFAFLDWRVLRARGVDRPFHWAWIFLAVVATNGVYVIGRGVVLRRRTGTGLTPIWVWIAVTVLSWIVGIVFAVVLINDVFAILMREGLLTP